MQSDRYVAEFDGDDIFIGYAEWGYISFTELKDITVALIEVDCELGKMLGEIQFLNI